MSEALQVVHEPDRSRYVGRLAGVAVSSVSYRTSGTTMIIISTVTDPAHRGAGHAGALTRYVLDDARDRGLSVLPRCPYTAAWMARHPEYRDLL